MFGYIVIKKTNAINRDKLHKKIAATLRRDGYAIQPQFLVNSKFIWCAPRAIVRAARLGGAA